MTPTDRRPRSPRLTVAALTLVATGLALTACGTTQAAAPSGPGSSASADSPSTVSSSTVSSSGAATATASASASTSGSTSSSASAQPSVPAIPAGFPLARGLAAGGDAHAQGPSPSLGGLFLEEACNLTAWPGPAVDRLVVRQTAPESEVVRDLEVYPDAATAGGVVDAVREHVAACPHQTGGSTADELVYTVVPTGSTGGAADGEVDYVASLPSGRPVGTVVRLVQVGRAVLGVTETGEWTLDSGRAEVPRLARRDADLVTRMRVFQAG